MMGVTGVAWLNWVVWVAVVVKLVIGRIIRFGLVIPQNLGRTSKD